MTSRRDWQLQQLGITQWALRRPTALQGEIAISIPAHVRLVMVGEELPALNEILIGDVLRSLKLTPDQVLQLTPERVAMLPPDSRCNSWRMGDVDEISLEGGQICSPALEELKANPKARSALWQQICEYENNFFPHDGRSDDGVRD
ncbi:DNA polymerase III, psi subunit [Enterobacter cancerogenus]|uniref:DNA polymerase III subunit psi n=1 Tax=Enterobacter cancerogenus TaxID=69218 RepID=UPI0019253118|nr:DNA polymerase III subunit psi [Enterobacter cancerogenus]CAD5352417.1 DNA polymerase III, psi subunit [Enterobacter cancerogenus]